MSKREHGQDRIQREIEELLDKLDTFVPEERLAEKIRHRGRRTRSSTPAGPGIFERLGKRLSRISLGQLMLAGVGLMIFAYFFRAPLGGLSQWLIIAGLAMAGVTFVLSIISGGASHTITGGGGAEKRWRGQVIDYSEPSAAGRIRGWFRRRRR